MEQIYRGHNALLQIPFCPSILSFLWSHSSY